MMPARRPRFSARIGAAQDDPGPFELVPDHLLTPLRRWVEDVTNRDDPVADHIALRLRIPLKSNADAAEVLSAQDGLQLLEVADEALAEALESYQREDLASILENAGSLYRLNEAHDGLEERVTPAVRDAMNQTIADAANTPTAGSAADHLAAAWQAAYGRDHDPVRAYSEAIKAVESAAHAVIEPNNPKATQGSMLAVLRNSRHKFTTAIPVPPNGDPLAAVETMLRALWEGQTSRHGSQTPTVQESLDAARAAVHLAATLVQWFVSGAVRRV